MRSSLNTSVLSYGRKNVETPNFVYVFEFKLDGTAEEALRQINEKDYAREYEADQRKLYKIGVVFSSETGTTGWQSSSGCISAGKISFSFKCIVKVEC